MVLFVDSVVLFNVYKDNLVGIPSHMRTDSLFGTIINAA